MSTMSPISLPNVVRLVDSGARIVKVSELPGSAERANRLLDSIVADARHQEERVARANAEIPTAHANLQRVQAIIEDLPETTSAKERSAWQRELEGAQNGVRSAQDELALAQSAQASLPERHLSMQKLISGLLGISLDETRAMYSERLDTMA
jgi:chromosome segregation ATPase